MKRTPLRRVSAKRSRELPQYTRLRAAFMAERPVCEVWLKEHGFWQDRDRNGVLMDQFSKTGLLGPFSCPSSHLFAIGAPRSTECHHIQGRGKNYLNVSTWLAVSAEAHRRIHSQPSWARANGFLK